MQMIVDESQHCRRKKNSLGIIQYESDSHKNDIKQKFEEQEELDVSSYSADSNLHSKMATPISARPVGNYTINDYEDNL